jgi:hypothetical protein
MHACNRFVKRLSIIMHCMRWMSVSWPLWLCTAQQGIHGTWLDEVTYVFELAFQEEDTLSMSHTPLPLAGVLAVAIS